MQQDKEVEVALTVQTSWLLQGSSVGGWFVTMDRVTALKHASQRDRVLFQTDDVLHDVYSEVTLNFYQKSVQFDYSS